MLTPLASLPGSDAQSLGYLAGKGRKKLWISKSLSLKRSFCYWPLPVLRGRQWRKPKVPCASIKATVPPRATRRCTASLMGSGTRPSAVGSLLVHTAIPVLIDSYGQLGTASSSARFKKDIQPMDQTSESILALKPVTFHYKHDNTDMLQFGLVAEDVAKVNPDLVVRDKNGEIYSVRYDAVNAMLLNEFLKEHRKVEEQQATIGDLRSTIAQQQKAMQALAAQLSAQDAKLEKV